MSQSLPAEHAASPVWWTGFPAPDQVPDVHLVAAIDRALVGTGLGAEHIRTHIDRAAAVAATAMSIGVTGPADPVARGRLAAELGTDLGETPAPEGSRCVRFPGQDQLLGDHTIAEITTVSAIDDVAAVGTPVEPDDVVATDGFLRPTLIEGRLVLLVEPTADRRLRPTEVRAPHQCCARRH